MLVLCLCECVCLCVCVCVCVCVYVYFLALHFGCGALSSHILFLLEIFCFEHLLGNFCAENIYRCAACG